MSAFHFLSVAVRALLERPDSDWSVQGFGMMRAYIPGPVYDKQFRIMLIRLSHTNAVAY